jgi:hypothetical protein
LKYHIDLENVVAPIFLYEMCLGPLYPLHGHTDIGSIRPHYPRLDANLIDWMFPYPCLPGAWNRMSGIYSGVTRPGYRNGRHDLGRFNKAQRLVIAAEFGRLAIARGLLAEGTEVNSAPSGLFQRQLLHGQATAQGGRKRWHAQCNGTTPLTPNADGTNIPGDSYCSILLLVF